MADTHDKATRSYNMSQIKSKNTKPEVLVRKFLFSKGFRFRLHDRRLPGRPDIVLPKYRTVIFVNGCFWHAHKHCRYSVMPKSNKEYWLPKIQKNVQKDKLNNKELVTLGWQVITVWECNLKPSCVENELKNVLKKLLPPQLKSRFNAF